MGDSLVLRFTDTGMGIPEEMEDRLFEMFATAGWAGGTGLGLAIVKKIITEHHGRITYETMRGHGTTFTVTLPLTRDDLESQPNDEPDPGNEADRYGEP